MTSTLSRSSAHALLHASPAEISQQLAELASLAVLSSADRQFLAAKGTLRELADGELIELRRGDEACVAVVLEGELASAGLLTLYSVGQSAGLETLAPREAQLAECPRLSATMSSVVLLVPVRALHARAMTAPAFAARLYRAALLSVAAQQQRGGELDTGIRFTPLDQALAQMSAMLQEYDATAARLGGELPQAQRDTLAAAFDELVKRLEEELGDQVSLDSATRQRRGELAQRSLLPYLLLTETSERLYSKPRGYAGDSESIDGIYANEARGHGRLGPLLDRCFLNQPAAQAVRNRRALVREEILALLEKHPGRRVEITSMACGPAREVFDIFDQLEDPSRLNVHLIDFDEQALELVRAEAERRGLLDSVHAVHGNLIKLALGRSQLELPPQDLVYSIGLIDYFESKLVVKLLNLVYSWLADDGQVMLGNFHPRNPCKALMDYVLDWRLIHRDESEMDSLFSESTFARPTTRIRFEDAGVNLFAFCNKMNSIQE